jgi:predicted CoA-binding protein
MSYTNPPDKELRALLLNSTRIAVVGASSRPDRPSLGIMKMLIAAGFDVVPVTPMESTILGRPTYPSLSDVPEPVDIVDVFRRPDETPPIAEEAVKSHAKVLWLQEGISNDEAAFIAASGGLAVVMDSCIGKAVHRLHVQVQKTRTDAP